jgi:superfamily I DNA/RNA helicase
LSCNIKSFIKGYDIGIGLIQLVKKTHKTTCNEVLIEYQKEIYREVVKMKRKGVKNPKNTEKIDNMNQRLEIIKILSKDLKLSKDLINKISSIFKESGDGVMLSTIHKAKGTENNRVFILLPKLIPSQYATQVWQMEQEMNLMYVAITRAKNELIYINEDDFKKVKEKIED